MQLYVILLVLGIVAHDTFAEALPLVELGRIELLAWFVLPKLALALAYAWMCRRTLNRLADGRAAAALDRVEKATGLYRPLIVLLYFTDLALGALTVLRNALSSAIGAKSVIFIDELLILLPPLVLISWAWWAYYPIDRRMREATLMRRIDEGLPMHRIWTRAEYLVSQIRHQIALLLVPLLALLAWSEAVEVLMPIFFGKSNLALRPTMQMAGAGCIFLFAPVMIRHLWDTIPLPEGELRDRLSQMCSQHGVAVRELLLWRTFGGLINAAVMGLVRPLRFILLTDALLEQLPMIHVEAVMAHELGHVRRRHTFWLVATAAGLLVCLFASWFEMVSWSWHQLPAVGLTPPPGLERSVVDGTAIVLAIAFWLLGFGWISRRFERQADTFAVQHMAAEDVAGANDGADVRVSDAHVSPMVGALQRVAHLNHMHPAKRSWRHGSIAWRQSYLRSLVGRSVGDLPIDRQVRSIKLVTLVAIAAALSIHLWG